MPLIGWLFILAAIAMVVGSLLFLRDSANMQIPEEKLEKSALEKLSSRKKNEKRKSGMDSFRGQPVTHNSGRNRKPSRNSSKDPSIWFQATQGGLRSLPRP